MGNGEYRQFITCCLFCSFLLRGRTPHSLPLLQCGVPPVRETPLQTSPTHTLPAVLHELFQCRIPSMGERSFRNKQLQHRSPVGLQVLPANLLQCSLPTESQLPSSTSIFSSMRSSTGCRRQPVSPGSSPWTAQESLLRYLEPFSLPQ